MGQEQKKDKTKGEVVEEYVRGGISLRELEAKYGVARQTIHRWVKGAGAEKPESSREGGKLVGKQSEEVPKDVRRLQKELEEARLYNELLNAMIDIAEDQLGVDIRKKRGAKRR